MVVFHLQLLLLLLSFSWQAFALCCPDFRITPSPDTSPLLSPPINHGVCFWCRVVFEPIEEVQVSLHEYKLESLY